MVNFLERNECVIRVIHTVISEKRTKAQSQMCPLLGGSTVILSPKQINAMTLTLIRFVN